MYRSLPVCNKICARKADKRNKDIHKRKLKEMRSAIDTREPEVCHLGHVKVNAKREQLLEERYFEIDRENRILLQKMSDIMRHPSATMRTARTMGVNQPGPASLNKHARQLELMRITRENRGILKRIQNAQPQYSHVKWEQSFRQNRSYLRNCCDLPFVLDSPRRVGEYDSVMQSGASLSLSGRSGGGSEMRSVFKEGRQLGAGYYLVEMITNGRMLTISAYDGQRQKALELVINERSHRRLYHQVAGDYSRLAVRLAIQGGRLVLLAREPSQLSSRSIGKKARTADISDSPCKPLTAEDMIRPAAPVHDDGVFPTEIADQVEVEISPPSSSAAGRAPRVYVRGFTPSTASVRSGYN